MVSKSSITNEGDLSCTHKQVKVRTFTAWALKLFAKRTEVFPSYKESPKVQIMWMF